MAGIALSFVWFFFLPFANPKSFTPYCTLPEEDVNYLSGPNVRSTLQILWSSISTIFLCTWTVLHLNIPMRKESRQRLRDNSAQQNSAHQVGPLQPTPDSKFISLQDIKSWLLGKPKWMVLTIMVPEFLVGKSMADFVAAWRSKNCSIMKQHADIAGIEWTLTHGFYANMGGFILIDGSEWCTVCRNMIMSQPLDPVRRTHPEWGPNHSASDCRHNTEPTPISAPPAQTSEDRSCLQILDKYYSAEHNFWKNPEAEIKRSVPSLWSRKLPVAVRAVDLCAMLRHGVITRLPAITEEQIKAQSKQDTLIKSLTLLQVSWLLVQLIVRKIQGLPSAQLEIATLSYAICTFITSLFWLHKPKDLSLTTEVIAVRELKKRDEEKLEHLIGTSFIKSTFLYENDGNRSERIKNDIYNPEATFGVLDCGTRVYDFAAEDLGMILGAMAFGATHLIAWNVQFPTSTEQILWRIASLVTTSIIPLYYAIQVSLASWRGSKEDGSHSFIILTALAKLCSIITYSIYMVCRLFIMAEAFRSLFHLPIDAFKATWTVAIPYFS